MLIVCGYPCLPSFCQSSVDPYNVAGRDRKSKFPSIEVTKAQEIVLQHCNSTKEELISLRFLDDKYILISLRM